MGLIEFFKNLFKTPIPSRFEDLYNYDYNALIEKSIFLGKFESNGTNRYKYDVKLQIPFLNAFEKLRIEIWKEEKVLQLDDLINLFFFTERKTVTDEQVDYVIYSVVEACKKDEKYEENKAEAAIFKKGIYGSMYPVLIPARDGFRDVDICVSRKDSAEFKLDLCLTYGDLLQLAKENK